MVNPFNARRPWAVFLIALILSPFLGMLYIGRARLAGWYFLALLGLLVTFVLLYPAVLGSLRVADAAGILEWSFRLVGAGHAAYLAWKHKPSLPVAWYGRWYTVLGIPVGYVAIMFAVTRLLFMPYYLPSQSMLPNFAVNDKFFASRRAYDSREPARGDVIAFHSSYGNVVYIKRIVGLPHDRIAIRNGAVILNGKPLRYMRVSGGDFLEYLPNGKAYIVRTYYGGKGAFDNVTEQTVPPDHYFVLGDYRDKSLDSRFSDFGSVARDSIVGPVALKFFDGSTRRFVFQPIH